MAKINFFKILIYSVLKSMIYGIHGIPITSICIHNSTKLVLQELLKRELVHTIIPIQNAW
ncbi:hypothetical protein [Flavobacterium sp. FPG59]|uniref:hypothetical protein n=1 Tax=Flavobacterium sp. FPG59 TaxID=1929267 RepID=UPI000A3C3CFA|nr:hypothetical protein [Flavobacterium sp. FPG59]OUD35902.1 hypothetical protein FPG59_08605 [Flavobacterium sp. FPG59]